MTDDEKDSLDYAFELITTTVEGEGDSTDGFHDLATRSILRGVGRALVDIAESLRELLEVQKSATDGSKFMENLLSTVGGALVKSKDMAKDLEEVPGLIDPKFLTICKCLHTLAEHLDMDGPCTSANCPCEGFKE
jgi:hypothetical protein